MLDGSNSETVQGSDLIAKLAIKVNARKIYKWK